MCYCADLLPYYASRSASLTSAQHKANISSSQVNVDKNTLNVADPPVGLATLHEQDDYHGLCKLLFPVEFEATSTPDLLHSGVLEVGHPQSSSDHVTTLKYPKDAIQKSDLQDGNEVVTNPSCCYYSYIDSMAVLPANATECAPGLTSTFVTDTDIHLSACKISYSHLEDGTKHVIAGLPHYAGEKVHEEEVTPRAWDSCKEDCKQQGCVHMRHLPDKVLMKGTRSGFVFACLLGSMSMPALFWLFLLRALWRVVKRLLKGYIS